MIELTDVSVRYGATTALAVPALTLDGGSAVALMGPNGSGKTTMLRVMAGLHPPDRGRITRASECSVAYVGQHQHQHSWMPLTAREVITMGRYRRRGLLARLDRGDRSAVQRAAERLAVDDLVEKSFGTLSGGQRQRVLVAAALATEATCLLLDEPITGLDLPSQKVILDVIAGAADDGALVVISTHHLEEARVCDQVVLLRNEVVAAGPPAEVLTEPNLSSAFGPRLLTIDLAGSEAEGVLLVDDHGHGHEHAHDVAPAGSEP